MDESRERKHFFFPYPMKFLALLRRVEYVRTCANLKVKQTTVRFTIISNPLVRPDLNQPYVMLDAYKTSIYISRAIAIPVNRVQGYRPTSSRAVRKKIKFLQSDDGT